MLLGGFWQAVQPFSWGFGACGLLSPTAHHVAAAKPEEGHQNRTGASPTASESDARLVPTLWGSTVPKARLNPHEASSP